MAEVAPVLFKGGPCAGRRENRLVSDLRDGHVACMVQRYDAYEVSPGEWLAVLPGVRVNPAAVVHSASAARAWQRQVHAIHSTVPRQVGLARQAAARMLRRGRR